MERITPAIQRYDWGSTDAIPEFLGAQPDGGPWAEAWLGTHGRGPSLLADGSTLSDYINADPNARLGVDVVAAFGQLPFLFKVLAAAKPLSIQTHPNRAQAEEGFARENAAGIAVDAPNRSYRDANHKPELICALTPFQALCGFRDPASIGADFRAAGGSLVDLANVVHNEGLAQCVAAALRLDKPHEAVQRIQDCDAFPRWLHSLAADFPDDPGVIVAAMLQHHSLQPGEALYLDAGNVHAYLSGTGLELMANSDNVLRCGLTPKHIDVEELLRVMVPSSTLDPRVQNDGHRYITPASDFELQVVDHTTFVAPAAPSIVVCTEGLVELACSTGTLHISRGQCVFVGADDGQCTIDATNGVAYRATVAGT